MSSKTILINFIIFPHRFGTRDHWIILVDFKHSDVAGHRINICSPGMQRLMHENKLAIDKYIKKASELLQFH